MERWVLRILCAVAIVFVGFAHRPPTLAQASEIRAAYAEYLLPDGSLASLCLTVTEDDGTAKDTQNNHHKHFDQGCEACRISAASLLPVPAAAIDGLFSVHVPAVLHIYAQIAPRRSPPPNTGPRAPPLFLTIV
jgi:hypothetical protein